MLRLRQHGNPGMLLMMDMESRKKRANKKGSTFVYEFHYIHI